MPGDFDHAILVQELERDEGLRLKPYADSKGIETIGIGRNLRDVGLTREEAYHLLANDIERAVEDLDQFLSWWRRLDCVRQRVLMNWCFNMGIARMMTFKPTLDLIQAGRYAMASEHMLASLWDHQAPERVRRLSDIMRTGTVSK